MATELTAVADSEAGTQRWTILTRGNPMNYITQKKFSVPLHREEVSRSWSQRGYSCDLFIDPPGREWNDFVHSTNELVTVVDGKLKMTIEGEEVIAEPGDEVFIPKGAVHSVKNMHHASTHWLYGYD